MGGAVPMVNREQTKFKDYLFKKMSVTESPGQSLAYAVTIQVQKAGTLCVGYRVVGSLAPDRTTGIGIELSWALRSGT